MRNKQAVHRAGSAQGQCVTHAPGLRSEAARALPLFPWSWRDKYIYNRSTVLATCRPSRQSAILRRCGTRPLSTNALISPMAEHRKAAKLPACCPLLGCRQLRRFAVLRQRREILTFLHHNGRKSRMKSTQTLTLIPNPNPNLQP